MLGVGGFDKRSVRVRTHEVHMFKKLYDRIFNSLYQTNLAIVFERIRTFEQLIAQFMKKLSTLRRKRLLQVQSFLCSI